ncbi:MAG: aminopeptidase, partial [Nevskiaceae bacterium]
MTRRWRLPALLLAVAAGLASCSTLNYYAHLGRGQWQLLKAREPIDRILADPQRDPELRRR